MARTINFEGRLIDVPDDASDAEVSAILSSSPKFDTLPGGAAVLAPQVKPSRRGPTGTELLQDVGGASVFGAGLGYAAPAMLKGAGTMVNALPGPMAKSVGAGLTYAGTAAETAGPLARTISGGLSGMGSEIAGKTAEGLGAGPVTTEVARFAGGAITPEFARLSGRLATNIFSKFTIPGNLTDKAIVTLARDISAKVRDMTGGPLSAEEEKYITALVADLQGSRKPGEAFGTVGATLKTGAEDITRTAAQKAQAVLGGAEQKAAQLHNTARTILNESETAAREEIKAAAESGIPRGRAISYIETLKQNALDTAKQTRTTIGQDRDLTQIGGELRAAATARENSFRTTASESYKTTAAEVAQDVAKKETAGLSVTALPAYKQLVTDLQAELKPGKHAPDVAAAYKKILTQLTGAEAKPLGVLAQAQQELSGAIPAAPAPVSFQAIDDARRLLGEAFRGQPAEGYAAIGEIAQKQYYQRLSQLQKDFAGEKQAKLLADYADSRPGLEIFGSKAGQKLVGADKQAINLFATDPKAIPTYYFKTPTSFNNLIELVGSKDLATKAAQDYAANQLAARQTSREVGTWMTNNREFLNAVPEVKSSVINFKNTLDAAERTAKTLDTGVNNLRAQQTALTAQGEQAAAKKRQGGALQATAATTEAEAVAGEAAGAAGAITKRAAETADKIFANSGVAKNVRGLIEGGDFEAWGLAAPIIQRSPEAKRAVYDAVRQVTSEMATSKNATQKFTETIRPAMEKFGMLGTKEADQIAAQLAEIEARRMPDADKLGLARRLILQGIAGFSSTLGTRADRAGFSLVPDIPGNALTPPSFRKQNEPQQNRLNTYGIAQ